MKKTIFILTTLFMFVFSACTDNFLETNTNPYQISDESLQQDFNNLGAFYPAMLQWLFDDQISHNLAHEAFVRHLGTPTNFVANRNNTTYYITWNSYWGRIYGSIMAPSNQVIELAQEGEYDVFEQWAIFIRLLGASRLSAYQGPIIYSNYGSSEKTILYDSEETLYNTWFAELDAIHDVFAANLDYEGLNNFDASFGGDVGQWLKAVNSWRLVLAMRISKVAPALAKTQGEKAMSDPGGIILTNADNFNLSLYGGPFKPARICFNWDDTRMSATMESVLVGYEDSRIAKLFDEATGENLCDDHPDYYYKGIHAASFITAKDQRIPYSTISSDFKSVTSRRFLTASDILFTVAEAALRGWDTNGYTTQQAYEDGVKASFAEWGAGGVDAYLADDTKLPLDYIDPRDDRNNFANRMTVTVKWDEGADNEVKLDKILTQKWISSFHNTIEIWVDHRRTGYPKLPYNAKNDSNSDWGVIPADDFLRRMPFVNGERNNNPDGVADATTKLGGPDEIGTRLWWDTGGPNFP